MRINYGKITSELKPVIESRLKAGESLRSIADSFGVTHQTLQYHRRVWGCSPLKVGMKTGSAHHSWRGGKTVDRHGYTLIRSARNIRRHYTAEHILLAEAILGRRLLKNEVVHHINGIKSDNSPDNLFVCDKEAHKLIHWQLSEVAMMFFREGKLVFKKGRYCLA